MNDFDKFRGVTRSPHLIIIDPASDRPETANANQLALSSPVPTTYHLPALFGMDSIVAEEPGAACGMILLGSASSVNDRSPWQRQLEAWLERQFTARLPTLAICFGHQLVASMFGATVGPAVPSGAYLRGLRQVSLDQAAWGPAASGELVVAHGEEVLSVPTGMHVFARSQEVAIDGLAHDELPLWTLQSHPEADRSFLRGQDISPTMVSTESLIFGHKLVRQFVQYTVTTYTTEPL